VETPVFEWSEDLNIYIHLAKSRDIKTSLEYNTRVVHEGDCRCKKSTLNDLVHLTPLRMVLLQNVASHYVTE
jgi:hypothetical protein